MKMAEAAIEWVPAWWSDGEAPRGSVRVAQKKPGWSIWQACWLDVGRPLFWQSARKPSENERVLQMLLDFHAMVVRDGIDPQTLHGEMLKVEEYRQHIVEDIPGAVQ